MYYRSLSWVTLCLLVAAPLAAARPVAVSPGLADSAAAAPDRCPTFLWGQVAGAHSYELVVYGLDSPSEPVLRERLDGSVHGWTPSLGRCLAEGGRYAWVIGARTGEGEISWSEPKLFRTPALLSRAEFERALAVVRDYLAQSGPPASPPHGSMAESAGSPAGAAGSSSVAGGGPASRAIGTPVATALTAEEAATTGIAFGLHGISKSTDDGSIGAVGQSTANSGDTAGVAGQVASAAGSAGVFDNTAGGDILRGLNNGAQVFEVAGSGQVTATGFTGDGSALTGVTADDADTLDGIDSTAFLQTTELDSEAELEAQIGGVDVIVSTEIDSEAELEALLVGVSDVLTDNDTLDADTLDGVDSSGFAPAAGSTVYLAKAGDTMSGDLDMDGNSITEVSGLSRTGASDLTLSSGQNIDLNAVSGDINLNASDSTIHLNANTEVAGTLSATEDDATNAGVTEVATLVHTTSGSAGAGIGVGLRLQSEDAAGNVEDVARIDAVLTDAGDGTEASELRLLTRSGGGALSQAASLDGSGNLTATGFTGDGSALTGVTADDADTLDGIDSAAFLQTTELDSQAELEAQIGGVDVIVSTEIDSEAELEALLVGVSDVLTDNDTLDADTLDGVDSTAFLLKAGDTMAGDLGMAGNNIVGLGNVQKGGNLFLHTSAVGSLGLGDRALASNTSGSFSTAMGTRALFTTVSGSRNSAFGFEALYADTSGDSNSGFGDHALRFNTTGAQNTATGAWALRDNVTGLGNTATGNNALEHNIGGAYNTAVGRQALRNNTASNTTAVGHRALYNNTTGSGNVALGHYAGYNADTGSNNIFIGNQGVAGDAAKIKIGTAGTHTTAYVAGVYNVAPGGTTKSVIVNAAGKLGTASGAFGDADTLDGLDSADFLEETELDTEAELEAQIGGDNVVVATEIDSEAKLEGLLGDVTDVLTDNDSVNADTLDGVDSTGFVLKTGDTMTGTLTLTPGAGNALNANDDVNLAAGNLLKGGVLFIHDNGDRNNGFGYQALANVTGLENTAVGHEAMRYATSGNSNVAVGPDSLRVNAGGIVNTAVGRAAMYSNTTGSNNIAVGADALRSNTIGSLNAALGRAAMLENVSGSRNSAVGRYALRENTSGDHNTALGANALRNNTASSNTAVGSDSLRENTTGIDNTAMGYKALAANTVGARNVAFGGDALRYSTGSQNTAIGDDALRANTTGGQNTAVGQDVMIANTTGSHNAALGSGALFSNIGGARNVALGEEALRGNTSGNNNTAIGTAALYGNSTGSTNVAIGYKAGFMATTGDNNIFISNQGAGGDAGKIRIGIQGVQSETFVAGIHGTSLAGSAVVVTAGGQLGVAMGATGDADTIDGLDSGQFLRSDVADSFTAGTLTLDPGTTLDVDGSLALPAAGITGAGSGSGLDADTLDGIDSTAFLQGVPNHGFATRNTRVGQDALVSTTGSDNSAIGYKALTGNTTGYDNTATGANALRTNTIGTNNTAHGYDALRSNLSGDFNTAVGDRALQANTVDKNTALGAESLRANTTGTGNTAAGYATLLANTTGIDNTAMGYKALAANTMGARNVAFGGDALRYSTGSQNTALGDDALRANTTGGQNSAVGQDVMIANTTGSRNVAMGSGAMFSNSDGDDNVAIGEEALRGNTSGNNNTGLGTDALYGNTTGSTNVAIGYKAGFMATTGDNNIFVSNQGAGGDAGKIRVGIQGVQTATYIAGIHGTSLAGSSVVVTAGGQLGVAMGATGNADTVDGFEGADLVAVAGDTMTGTLTLSPSSGDALVTTAGEVGIGTSTPSKTLHVKGTGGSSGAVFHHDAVGSPITSPFLSVETDGFSTSAGILSVIDRRLQTNLSTTPTLRVENSNASTFGGNPLVEVEAAGSPRFLVQHNGRVGMGISSPSGSLHVVGDGAQLYLEDSGSGAARHVAQLFMDGSQLRLIANHFTGSPTLGLSFESRLNGSQVNAMTIAGNGDVGIGDTTPTHQLDVAGDVTVGSETEALDNPGFALNGNDLYVAGDAGVDGTIYTDSGVTVGATTTLADGSLTSSGDLSITPNSGSSNLLITAGNLSLSAARLEVSSVIRTTPTDSPGTCDGTTEGSFYYDASQSEPCFCDGTNWKEFDSGTNC